MTDRLWRLVAAMTVVIAASPITTYVLSLPLAKIWQWFLADQYGSGPSTKSWMGAILATSTFMLIFRKEDKDDENVKVPSVWELAFVAIFRTTILVGLAFIEAAWLHVFW